MPVHGTHTGAALLGEPSVMWERIRVAYLRDPDGNLVELQQWLAPRDA
jgi:lactoylglutathione lyase